jgi:cytochrome c-type biogenesis protein CcmE
MARRLRVPDSESTATLGERLRALAFPAFIVVLVLSGLGLVVHSSTSGGVYYLTLAELEAKSSEYVGQEIRVTGVVQAESFYEAPGDEINIEFTIGDNDGNLLEVRFHQLLPDAFQEGREVIVWGRLLSADTIECDRLTVKCPSKYKDEGLVGEQLDTDAGATDSATEAAPVGY